MSYTCKIFTGSMDLSDRSAVCQLNHSGQRKSGLRRTFLNDGGLELAKNVNLFQKTCIKWERIHKWIVKATKENVWSLNH